MQTTGERIREYRKARGITQQELAERLDCHVTTVSKWEADDNMPRGDNLVALALALDVSVVELLYGKE